MQRKGHGDPRILATTPGHQRRTLAPPTGGARRHRRGRRWEAAITVDGPGWFAAISGGGDHPNVLAPLTYAHTSPVHVEVDGRRIGRAVDISIASVRAGKTW